GRQPPARPVRRAVRPISGPDLRLRRDPAAQPGRRRGGLPADLPRPVDEVGPVRPGPRLRQLGLRDGPLRGPQLPPQDRRPGPGAAERGRALRGGPDPARRARRAGGAPAGAPEVPRRVAAGAAGAARPVLRGRGEHPGDRGTTRGAAQRPVHDAQAAAACPVRLHQPHPRPGGDDMTDHGGRLPETDAELWALVEAAVEGTATPAETARLDARLRTEPAARAFYVAYLDLHAFLQWRNRGAAPLAGLSEPAPPARRPARRPMRWLAVAAATAAVGLV